MNFNDHSDLLGLHAFLGASKYSWVNYTPERLDAVYRKHEATIRGTELHDLACRCIRLGVHLPKSKNSFNLYVNDAIGFRMTPEQVLYYSENAFGTADTISFRKNFLRIHDLKTGSTIASMRQLEIYAALFCLEYSVDPRKIETELRIYQTDEVVVHNPPSEDIEFIMKKMMDFDRQIEQIKLEG